MLILVALIFLLWDLKQQILEFNEFISPFRESFRACITRLHINCIKIVEHVFHFLSSLFLALYGIELHLNKVINDILHRKKMLLTHWIRFKFEFEFEPFDLAANMITTNTQNQELEGVLVFAQVF